MTGRIYTLLLLLHGMVSLWSGVVLNGEYYERVFVMITGDEMMVCIYDQSEWVTVTINN